MSKELTSIYFAWLNQVAEDNALPAAAFKLAFIYQQHINNGHMKAFAGQARLARAVGVTDRSIRTLTKLLKDRGHLDVVTNHGPNNTNVCRLIINRKSASAFKDDVRGCYLRPIDGNEEAGFLINEEVERKKSGKNPQKSGSQLPTNYSSNDSYNQAEAGPSSADALGPLGERLAARIGRKIFDAWFSQARLGQVTDDQVTIELPNAFSAARTRQDYEVDVLACCRSEYPTVRKVQFVARQAA